MARKRRSRVKGILIICVLFIAIAVISNYLLTGLGFNLDTVTPRLKNWIVNLTSDSSPGSQGDNTNAKVEYKFAIISDSHEDLDIYPQIVHEISMRNDLTFVAHLGDQSNAGEVQKLHESKSILDTIAVPVYVLPGDHDSNWLPRRDLTNFKQVFNLQQTSYSVAHGNEKYIFIDNSDSNDGISPQSWDWMVRELESSQNSNIYVFMSTPLSNPYLSFKTMGSQSEKVKRQAGELGVLLQNNNIKVVFAGDTHTFSKYKDESTHIPIITVGAAGTNKNPLPLYVIVEILSDGSYNVSSVPLKQ